MDAQELMKPVRAALEERFGDRLRRLVLFGSSARGEATEDSDIDLMVVLEGPVDLGLDTRAAIDAVYPVLLARGVFRPLHAVAADEADYDAGRIALYRAIKEHGIAA
jgi:predicted nucleotidyltransferase